MRNIYIFYERYSQLVRKASGRTFSLIKKAERQHIDGLISFPAFHCFLFRKKVLVLSLNALNKNCD